jgi:hypothetical protein
MLSNVDKEKIIELRRQNITYKAIRAETGFALQTISNVIKEDKDKNLQAEEETDLNKKIEDEFLQNGMVSFDSSIDKAREIMDNIQTLINNGNLQEGDRREWERRLGYLKEILRVEVEYKISEGRSDAANSRDIEWQDHIDQVYVPKEVAENLESTVMSQNATIEQLRNVIVQKDAALANMQNEMMHLKESHQMAIDGLNGQINNYYWEIQRLVEENWYKHNVILDYQYYYDQREQELINRDRELDQKEIKLKEAIYEADKKHKENERWQVQLDDESELFKKRKFEFEEDKKQLFNAFNKRMKSVEKREVNVEIAENIVLTQKEKNDLDSKKIKNEMEKLLKERENINNVKEELEKARESFNKQKQALKKNRVRNVVLKPYTSNSKLISKADQKTGEQKKPVVLHPAFSGGKNASIKDKNVKQRN